MVTNGLRLTFTMNAIKVIYEVALHIHVICRSILRTSVCSVIHEKINNYI